MQHPMEMRKSCSVVSTLCWRLLSMIHPRVFTFPCLIKGSQEWETVIADNCTYCEYCVSDYCGSEIFSISLSFSQSLSLFLFLSPDLPILDENATKQPNIMKCYIGCLWQITSLNTVYAISHTERVREASFVLSLLISDVRDNVFRVSHSFSRVRFSPMRKWGSEYSVTVHCLPRRTLWDHSMLTKSISNV